MHISNAEFDKLLVTALYRAAELDYCTVPTDDELDALVQPSLRFSRRINALLKDQHRYIRNHRRPVYMKVLRAAAAILIAFTVLLGTAMAVSPTVRAAVVNFVRSWFEDRTIYQTPERNLGKIWIFEYIPEGFELYEDISNEIQALYIYIDSVGTTISISISTGRQGVDNEHSFFSQTIINGNAADVYESYDSQYPNMVIMFDDREGVFITLVSEIEIDELIKIAENIK